MSRKFFSLIKAGAIHTAPKKKIIPSEEFSSLLEGKALVEEALEDAKKFRIQVAEEGERQKEQAAKEGFAEGFDKWAKQLAFLESEIHRLKGDFEKVVVPVALKAAKKIVGAELALREDAVVDIVSNSLKSVSQHKKVAIFVNKKDLDILEANRPKIKQIFENIESLTIRERMDVEPGGCIIETEAGIINAQLDNQWRVLEKAFQGLMKQKESEGHKEQKENE